MCEWCVLSCYRHACTQNDPEERWSFLSKQPLSLAATKSVLYAAVSVQQHWYNGSRARSSCVCASSRGLCVWLVHNRRSKHDNLFTSNSTIKHTSSDLLPGIRSIQRQQQQALMHIIGTPVFALFDLRRPRDMKYMKSTPSRRGSFCVV